MTDDGWRITMCRMIDVTKAIQRLHEQTHAQSRKIRLIHIIVEQCNGSKSYSILFHILRGIFGFPSVNYLNLAEMDCYKRPVTSYVI